MNAILSTYLFNRGYFVSTQPAPEYAPDVATILAYCFGIRLTSHPELADLEMVHLAEDCIGIDVPDPFYIGFPASVRMLTADQLLMDQILHYASTYDVGNFSDPGHSVFEDEVERTPLSENVTERPFAILTQDEADIWILGESESLLARTRPLSDEQFAFVVTVHDQMDLGKLDCVSKDTAARLVLATRDIGLSRWLKLSDVLRVVEWLACESYDGATIKKLSLRSQDRRFIASILDYVFENGYVNKKSCLERRRDWKGLLHHLHYRPRTQAAVEFCACVREGRERSAYSDFERLLVDGDAVGAARLLLREKGEGALVRRLNHILSRTSSDKEFDAVLDLLDGTSTVTLIQLAVMYHLMREGEPRDFVFSRFGLLRVHHEEPVEMERRLSTLPENWRERAKARVRDVLSRSCAGRIGRVYVDEEMRLAALPFAESVTEKGVWTFPPGSRTRIGPAKTFRAFVWWKLVNDIDLSCFAVGTRGRQEFSWRTTASYGGLAELTFSGDETSGYDGGSEYIDVDLLAFHHRFPDAQYLVFCASVYTNASFSDCICRSGYMLREHPESGEVFEPSTVGTAIDITCKTRLCYLFAIDLERIEVVWLNLSRDIDEGVAGRTSLSPLWRYLEATNVMSLWDLARMSATEVVDTPAEADIVFSNSEIELSDGQEQVRSLDTARISEIFAL